MSCQPANYLKEEFLKIKEIKTCMCYNSYGCSTVMKWHQTSSVNLKIKFKRSNTAVKHWDVISNLPDEEVLKKSGRTNSSESKLSFFAAVDQLSTSARKFSASVLSSFSKSELFRLWTTLPSAFDRSATHHSHKQSEP